MNDDIPWKPTTHIKYTSFRHILDIFSKLPVVIWDIKNILWATIFRCVQKLGYDAWVSLCLRWPNWPIPVSHHWKVWSAYLPTHEVLSRQDEDRNTFSAGRSEITSIATVTDSQHGVVRSRGDDFRAELKKNFMNYVYEHISNLIRGFPYFNSCISIWFALQIDLIELFYSIKHRDLYKSHLGMKSLIPDSKFGLTQIRREKVRCNIRTAMIVE